MPILDAGDALDVERGVERVFAAGSAGERLRAIRRLFVEVADFEPASGEVSLAGRRANAELPNAAHRAASLEGFHVIYVDLNEADTSTNRVRKEEASDAARLIADQLGDDLLLVFTNAGASQLHLIYPDFTSATPTLRRMIVERDLSRRTAVQQVANIYHRWRALGSLRAALDEAFDVEAVTREFFAEYKRVFDNALSMVRGFDSDEDARLYVQTLFNRLMFVYFLSRKGWLSFRGDNDYLNALWRDYANALDSDEYADGGEPNFNYDRLRPLFFGGLNNPDSANLTENDASRRLIGSVPFLNGGLFEPSGLDARTGVSMPDEAIRPLMTDLFDRFNFTVMESTPFDIEIAVDPEMLGKVFEELVTGRHSSGSYYTPRPVVSFMCREALKGYLEGADTGLDPDAIAKFVDERDTSGVSLASARAVGAALDDVTVVDPACGSGAYLLGMMQELVELQTTLYNVVADSRSLYELKLHVIRRSLYGADIDKFAVNIAMLRLWLSLSIEYEGATPEPLPNLDFKIVTGDSLLGPDPSPSGYGDLFRHRVGSVAGSLSELKREYMISSDGARKDALRNEIQETQSQLRDAIADSPAPAGAVDWRVEFAEVFERGGFDVAVANPPYAVVSATQLRTMYPNGVDGIPNLNRHLRDMYKEGLYGRANLYGLFIQRSLQLLNEGGRLLFINPRTLLTDSYFRNLRKLIKRKSELRGVVLIEDRHNTFAKVLQKCIILHLAAKSSPSDWYGVKTLSVQIPSELNGAQDYFGIDSETVLMDEKHDHSFYIGVSDFEYDVLEIMECNAIRLADLGIKAETGKIQFDKYRKYARSAKSKGASRLIWSENVQRYAVRDSHKRVGKEWLSSDIAKQIQPNIIGNGIVTQRVSANEQPRRIIATLTTPGAMTNDAIYSENRTNFISLDGREDIGAFLLGTLNSSAMEYLFRRLNSNTQVSAGEINKLPFPAMPSDETLAEIAGMVRRIMELGGVDCPPDSAREVVKIERKLDDLIGSLYGLSRDDVYHIQNGLPSHETVYGLPRNRGPIKPMREIEDEAMIRLIEEGKTGEYVSHETMMEILRGSDG